MTKKNKATKKVLVGSLAVAMLTNNVIPATAQVVQESQTDETKIEITEENVSEEVEATEVKEEIVETKTEKIELEQPKEEVVKEVKVQEEETTPVSSTEFEVNDYQSLKHAIAVDGATINIVEDITFKVSEQLEITGNNITINGNDHTLDLNETDKNVVNKMMVRGKGVSIKDLTFNNYTSVGLYAYKTTGLKVENVKFNVAQEDKPQVGIDLDGSEVSVENVITENHKYSGIRLRNKSTINVLGQNDHINDYQELEVVGTGSIINQPNKTYYGDSGVDNNKVYYNLYKTISVQNYNEFKKAILRPNTIVNLETDIILAESIETSAKRVKINGRDFTIDGNNEFKITVKGEEFGISEVVFANYTSGALSLYNAKNAEVYKVKFMGNETSKPKDERSTYGLDIYNSTVSLEGIKASNHLYRGIQVRNGSIVEVKSQSIHVDDKVHMQVIQKDGEKESVINDPNGYYIAGTPIVDKNKTATADYFTKREVEVSSPEDFKDNIGVSGSVLEIQGDIVFSEEDLPEGQDSIELVVDSNVVINGNGATLDLGGVASITFKGNDIEMNDITIKYSVESGIQLYNSRNVTIEGSQFVNSSNYGLIVNGSTVTLKNVFTGYNKDGGILITRSRTLDKENHIDSKVIIEEGITHVESNINVEVRNLQMVTDESYFQDNQFIAPDGIYTKHVGDVEYKALSQTYIDHFGLTGEDAKKKYKEQSIDYMIIQTQLDVTTQNVVKDDQGNPIRLIGDGETDNTENFKKLFEYASEHGIELFFPAGVYKITEDINLEEIDLPALSNFTVKGEENGLSIIDGSSEMDKMLKIKNAGYHAEMNYVSFENMVFNNVGLEFNGVYKKGVSVENNVFMNGKYTKEYNDDGKFYKATMTPYIVANNSKYVIESNVFLRGKEYVGRGIATYRTKNSSIKNNFFGNLDGLDKASEMLPQEVINKANMVKNEFSKSKDLSLNGSQGNFFTCINNERYDTNVLITNNYFNLDKTRNITSDFGEDILISSINVSKEGQRRDHIIYSKSYDGLNIYGNYFEGMANDASGGIKIRNGKNAYIGSNHFKNVPLLTYIYGDLTKEECTLYNTTIYNNFFRQTTNLEGEGTGILYYQSYRDGEDVNFKDETWKDAYGDVQNFVIYKNQFMTNAKTQITISNRATTAFGKGEFVAYENKYYGKDELVGYNKGNLSLTESSEQNVLTRVNQSFNTYKDTEIPLMPTGVDYDDINEAIKEAESFYNEILNDKLIADMVGYYDPTIAEELKNLLDESKEMVKNGATQQEVDERVVEIEETLKKLKDTEDKGFQDVPTTRPDDVPIVEVKPDVDPDLDEDMNVNPDEDQVVENEPTILPDDFEVDTNKPNDSDPEKDQVTDDESETDEPSEDVKPEVAPEENKPSDDKSDNSSTDKPSIKPEEDKVESSKPGFNNPSTGTKPEVNTGSNENTESKPDSGKEESKPSIESTPETGEKPSTGTGNTQSPSNNNATDSEVDNNTNNNTSEKVECEDSVDNKHEEDRLLPWLLLGLVSGLFTGAIAWFLALFVKRNKDEEEEESDK